MAKVNYTSLLSTGPGLAGTFASSMTAEVHTKTKAFYAEQMPQNSDSIIIKGKGLTYDGTGKLTGGTVTKVTFSNVEGDKYAVFTDLHVKASQLPDIKPAGPHSALIDALFKGNDVLHGSNTGNQLSAGTGNDHLIGGDGDDSFTDWLGNDRYTGGKGDDDFYFFGATGREVITDFNGKGADATHDMLFTQHEFKLKQSGDNVIVDFIDQPGTITLLDVKLHVVEDNLLWV